MATTDGMLKMSELAERSGVSAGTIKHYLREGLLGSESDVLRTSRNMAYYPEEFVERVRLIKRLQEERFMPLRVIREVMTDDPERAARVVELEDRILERAIEAGETGRVSRASVRETYDLPRNVLDRLEELEVLTPGPRGYDADDVAIIEAISRFRAGGYEEALGFTVYDTLRYREALEPLVAEEVRVLLDRLAGEVDVERAVEIISSGAEPLRELIGAMHSKLLLAELRRQRGRGTEPRHHQTSWSSITPKPVGQRGAVGQRAGEGAERLAVAAAHHEQVLAVLAGGLGVRSAGRPTPLQGGVEDDRRRPRRGRRRSTRCARCRRAGR